MMMKTQDSGAQGGDNSPLESGMQPVPITSQKHDPAWKHVQMFKNGDRVHLKCIYCGKIFKGGGIHRIKEHLAGQKGNASTCLHVLPDVRNLMRQSLEGVEVKKKKKQKTIHEMIKSGGVDQACDGNVDGPMNLEGEVNADMQQLVPFPEVHEPNSGAIMVNNWEEGSSPVTEKRKRGRPPKNSRPSTIIPSPALVTDVVPADGIAPLASIEINGQVHMAIGRFLYDVGMSPDAVNSIFFKPMVEAIASQGPGVLTPTYDDLRGWILKSSLEEVKSDLDNYSRAWARSGCSVLVEEQSNGNGMTKIANFLVSCLEGTAFLKSVDITGILDSPDAIFELLKQVVEEIGVHNVLQVITPNENRYALAGKKLCETISSLYWAPCAATSIDLILQDFGKLDWINTTLEQCKSITRFIYNHSVVLNMMRRYTFGVDLVMPGHTPSITNFKTLKRIVQLKQNLEALVTSREWVDSPYSKREGGLAALDFVSDHSFWSSCSLIVRLTDPLLRVSGIVCSEKRPAMGYVYAGIYRAKEVLKKELNRKGDYILYWNIIDQRWEQQRHLPLQAAGFYLNPKFFYSIEGDLPGEIVSGMFDCIERLVPDTKVQDKIIKELNLYKNGVGDFSRNMAIRARDTLLPAEWWSTYGGGCPNLTRLAVRILSQRCGVVQCKLDLMTLEQLHSTKNSLEHQRLSDLVFTQYNMRLRQTFKRREEYNAQDPISCGCKSSVEEWVAGKQVCIEDEGSKDWMAIEPPSCTRTLSEPLVDDAEELDAGFDDYEIFGGTKDEDGNTEDNMV